MEGRPREARCDGGRRVRRPEEHGAERDQSPQCFCGRRERLRSDRPDQPFAPEAAEVQYSRCLRPTDSYGTLSHGDADSPRPLIGGGGCQWEVLHYPSEDLLKQVPNLTLYDFRANFCRELMREYRRHN